MKKALVTLDINYNQEITKFTYPYMRKYAERIGADFIIINERKFPHLSCNMEKFQLYEIGANYDWTIFLDADALVHPNCPDLTELYGKEYVIFNRHDYYPFRFKHNNYVRRDGRNIAATTWVCIFSDWTRHAWKPHNNPEQFIDQINPMDLEKNFGYEPHHILDDYLVSRNIAKYGLKVESFHKLIPADGKMNYWFNHEFCVSDDDKVRLLEMWVDKIEKGSYREENQIDEQLWEWMKGQL
jgi:hypothetical protein